VGLLLGAGGDGDLAQSGSADFFFRADLARLGVGFGGRVLAQVKANYNRNVNDDAGALGEPIDDADFDEPIYVDQLWYERDFFDDRVHARLGYLDQQVAFDRNAYANNEDKQFLNTFLDNSPTVPLEIGLGALLVVEPTRWLELASPPPTPTTRSAKRLRHRLRRATAGRATRSHAARCARRGRPAHCARRVPRRPSAGLRRGVRERGHLGST
jgi:hypothetical protein